MTNNEASALAIGYLETAAAEVHDPEGDLARANVWAAIGQGYANVAMGLPYEEEDSEDVG